MQNNKIQSDEKSDGLKRIDAKYLQSGMFIESEIYIEINGKKALICSNVVLNNMLTKRLKRADESNCGIYINETAYNSIMLQQNEFASIPEEEFKPQIEVIQETDISDDHLIYDESLDMFDEEENEENYLRSIAEKLEVMENFDRLTQSTGELFQTVEETAEVSKEKADEVSNDISEEIETTDTSIIMQCINNVKVSDDYLYSHSHNVATLNGLMAKWMGLSKYETDMLIKTGLLHDVGKLKIAREILDKPGKLTDEEFEEIKKHPTYSYEILASSGFVNKTILKGVLHHQERINGMGYPSRLKGSDIPLYARITAVSDVYDAMVSKRSYKKAFSPFEILAEFASSRFSDLDLKIVNLLLDNLPKEFLGKKTHLSDGRIGKIISINPADYAYPIVRVGSHLIKTNKYLRCLTVDDFISTYDENE